MRLTSSATRQFDVGFCFWFTYVNAFDVPADGAEAARRLMSPIKRGGRMLCIGHSDLTAVRLPRGSCVSVMNYTIPQLT